MENHDGKLEMLQEKVNSLEAELGYLQRDYETQNEMILVYSRELSNLQKTVSRLNEIVESLSNANESSNRKLEDDKPPHY